MEGIKTTRPGMVWTSNSMSQNKTTSLKAKDRGGIQVWDVVLLFIYLFILFPNEGEEETQERGVIKG